MRLTFFSRAALPLAAVALLAGCLPYSFYYQQGTGTDTAARDEIACERLALSQAPVQIEHEVIPGVYIPGRRICDADGNCRITRGHYSPDRVRSRDVNEHLRRLIARQCMADRGYQKVSLPTCSKAVREAVTPTITRRMPALTPKSCVIRRGDGRYQIVPG